MLNRGVRGAHMWVDRQVRRKTEAALRYPLHAVIIINQLRVKSKWKSVDHY